MSSRDETNISNYRSNGDGDGGGGGNTGVGIVVAVEKVITAQMVMVAAMAVIEKGERRYGHKRPSVVGGMVGISRHLP